MSAINPLLPFGTTAEGLLVTMMAAVAFLIVLAIWYGLLERDPMERRARLLARQREELRSQSVREDRKRWRQKERVSAMRRVVELLKLMRTQQTSRLQERLMQAGIRSRDALVVFLFFKAVMPALLAALAFILLYLLQVGDLPPAVRLLAVLGGGRARLFLS